MDFKSRDGNDVALFTRAWIEIPLQQLLHHRIVVALFTRAWIEINDQERQGSDFRCRPLHEGVD